MSRHLLTCALLLSCLALASPAQQTLQVPSASYPTIQSAIDAAAPGDTVLIAAGSYGGGLTCTEAITIEGAGMGLTSIDGALSQHCIAATIPAGETLLLRNLTLSQGAGCIKHASVPSTLSSTVRLEQVRVSGGQATLGGGYNGDPHTRLELQACEFLNNGVPFDSPSSISSDGGAIYTQGDVYAEDCLFDGNSAHPWPATGSFPSGGNAAVASISLGGAAVFERCRFTNNKARSSTCIQNTSFVGPVGPLLVNDCIFANNTSTLGTSVISKSGTVAGNICRIRNSLFSGNSCSDGMRKLLFIACDEIEISGCTFADNDPATSTQAIGYLQALSDLKIRNTIFSNNGSDYLDISNSTVPTTSFAHNLAQNFSFSGLGTTLNNIEGIPAGFRDIGNDDFRLLPSSAARDAGFSMPGDATTDLDGLPRNQLGARDIGCYEMQPGEEDPGTNWAGTVPDLMGGFADVLLVDGSAGDASRRAFTSVGGMTTISVDAAPGSVSGIFIVWGRIGLPGPSEAFPIPFAQGSMAFLPHVLALGDPALFTLASSSIPGGIIASTPAPWMFSGSTLPFPLTITLQGLLDTGAGQVRLTNAIAVHNF